VKIGRFLTTFVGIVEKLPIGVSKKPHCPPGRGCWVDLIPSGGLGGGVEASAAAVRRSQSPVRRARGCVVGEGRRKRGAAL
jgi:hypothetical protein